MSQLFTISGWETLTLSSLVGTSQTPEIATYSNISLTTKVRTYLTRYMYVLEGAFFFGGGVQ